MEVVFFIFSVIVIMLLINIKNSFSTRFQSLENKVDDLFRDLRRTGLPDEPRSGSPATPESAPDVDVAFPARNQAAPPSFQMPPAKKKEVVDQPVDPAPERVMPAAEQGPSPVEEITPLPKPHRPGFFERNPDLEKFIGENLANKIGIGILVLGIGFFVKYAIDQDWINEIGRVFIGILCGGALLGVEHWLRKTFVAFSSVLVGGGIAVLYLTIGIAFHEYHIFSQSAAFLLMVVITGFAIVFSLAYNRVELAVLSLLGGLASPFMVSTGEGNYIILFTYILILDLGMLVLAYYKKWNLINIISYVGTILLFGSWMGIRFQPNNVSMIDGGLFFATAYYLTFFAMNMINNLRKRVPFKALEVSLLLSNTFLYYGVGMHLLNNPAGHSFQGLFTTALALFNFIFAFTLHRSDRVDKKVVYLLIGLVLTFASLAAPVQLEGNYITLFWAAEAVLLLWLSQKSGIRLMKLSSVIISVLMIFSLLMDWNQIYHQHRNGILLMLLNKGYITSMFSLASLASCFYLMKFEKVEKREHIHSYEVAVVIAGGILLYFSQFLELQYQLNLALDDTATKDLIIGTYNMIFITGLLLLSRKATIGLQLRQVLTIFGMVGIAAYVFYYHGLSIDVRDGYLALTLSGIGFLFHYVLILITILVAVLTLINVQSFTEINQRTGNLYGWFFVAVFVFIASAELDHAVVWIGYTGQESTIRLLSQNHKIGYPILWGITSFILIAAGMKWKKRHLRIISLTLFLVTLIKLFTVDIRGISEGGKIAAFISLGVLLLIVSFMYQRLKKLLLKDESGATQEASAIHP